MNSQTVRRPENKRPSRSQKPKKYYKQTARFEGKRDGKPLIFGWGAHLSHNEKVQIQRRATWITAISVVVLIVAVIIGFWVNINIIIPSQPITSVNGHPVPQSLYRKMVAFKTQLAQSSINGPNGEIAQRDSMKKQLADLQQQLQTDSVTWLQNDELIREWLASQNSQVQARVNPTAGALSQAMAAFKANIPKTSSYSAFLSKDRVSDDDMQAMMAVTLRRDNMQAYLASQVVSPTYQVQARMITLDTQQKATTILNELKHGGDFAKLAKASSVDNQTATKGGSLGWLARGQYVQNYTAANVEMWLFDPARKVNELSPIIKENGTFRIVQLMAIDHARALDAATLQSLKGSALTNWLTEQQTLPGTVITPVDQNKLLDAMNMPPDLPAGAPSSGSPSGAPGSAPGGIPGGGVPAQP